MKTALDRKCKKVAVLGSTGSIGRSALEVIRLNPSRFTVVSLAAGGNTALLKSQIREFRPRFVSVLTEAAAEDIAGDASLRADGISPELGFGPEGAQRAAAFKDADVVLSAIVGAAGFLPTLAAIRAGKDVALANKESLVIGGEIVMREAERRGVRLIPVDSEHSAVFQALRGHRKEDVRRIILTASGGPFLKLPIERLGAVTPEEALNHPTWSSMGRRITIDSATLMNKGFEVIEAAWLFSVPPERVSVCIHPQSIVHSMVEYIDGAIVAQMGPSDMKGPIAYALSYPERVESGVGPCELAGKTLEFIEPDPERFPSLGLAYRALELGGAAPCALNAADEVGVDMFLKGMIKFTDIYGMAASVLRAYASGRQQAAALDVDAVLEADRWGREAAVGFVKGRSSAI